MTSRMPKHLNSTIWRILMAATKLAFLFLYYDVRIKGYDLKFRTEEFEYAYFMMMKKKQGVKFSS